MSDISFVTSRHPGHRVGRHGDHGQLALAQAQALANFMGGFKAVHDRHLDIHQHHIELRCRMTHCVDTQLTIGRQRHAGPLRREQFFSDLLVDEVVFHHQDAHARELPLLSACFPGAPLATPVLSQPTVRITAINNCRATGLSSMMSAR